MDELKVSNDIVQMQQQMSNVAEDVKEIKEMLNRKSKIDEQQNTDIALLMSDVTNLQKAKIACSSQKDEDIHKLQNATNEHHDKLNSLDTQFNLHIENEKREQNKMRFQLGLMIPLITTMLTFSIDIILRFLHI